MSELAQKDNENTNDSQRDFKMRDNSVLKELLSLVLKLGVIIVVLLLVFTLIFGLYRGEDSSMSPTIEDSDIVMYYKLNKQYSARDTVLVKFEDKLQVRRIIATAGDEVDISEEGLLINGALQQEEQIYTKTRLYAEGVEFPLSVGEQQIFVLGDNREYSVDSRMYGVVDIQDTMGKVMAVLKRGSV